jgi:hypothetical protein
MLHNRGFRWPPGPLAVFRLGDLSTAALSRADEPVHAAVS